MSKEVLLSKELSERVIVLCFDLIFFSDQHYREKNFFTLLKLKCLISLPRVYTLGSENVVKNKIGQQTYR